MAAPSSPIADPRVFIGCKLSVISNADIRYEGTLYKYDENASTIALQYVHSFGTEDRRRDVIPAASDLFEFVIFRVADIKDLEVSAPPKIDLSRSRTNSITGDSAVLKCAAVPPASKPLTFKISPTAMMNWFVQQQQTDTATGSHQPAVHGQNNRQGGRSRRGRGNQGGGRGGNMHSGATMRAGGIAQRSGHLSAPWKDEYQNVWGPDKLTSAPVSEDAELDELSIAAHQFDYLDKVLNPSDWLTADKFLKLAAINTAKATEESDEDPKTFYDPEGFFDNISCEAKTVENGPNRTRQHEKKLNAETFNLPQRQQQLRFRYPQQGQSGRGPNVTQQRRPTRGGANNSNNSSNNVRSGNNSNNTSRNGTGLGGQGRQSGSTAGRGGGQGGAPQQRQVQNNSRNNAENWSSFAAQHSQQQQSGPRRRGPIFSGRRFGGNNNNNTNNTGGRQMGHKGQFVPSRVSENLMEFVSKLPMMVANENGLAGGSLGFTDKAVAGTSTGGAGGANAPVQFKWTFPSANAAGNEATGDENNGDFDFVRDKGLVSEGVAH